MSTFRNMMQENYIYFPNQTYLFVALGHLLTERLYCIMWWQICPPGFQVPASNIEYYYNSQKPILNPNLVCPWLIFLRPFIIKICTEDDRILLCTALNFTTIGWQGYVYGLVQYCSNSIPNTLELLRSGTKSSICYGSTIIHAILVEDDFHDDVIKWKHCPREADLWCLLWSAPEFTVG